MTIKLKLLATQVLLVTGLAWGITAASARDYNISRSQERQVQMGMSASELHAALGTPTAMETYGQQPQAWSYGVNDATPAIPGTRTMYVIELTNGRVVSASEFVVESGKIN